MNTPKLNHKIKYDGRLSIAVGRSRREKVWKNQELTWSELLARLSQPVRTQETQEEYQQMTKTQRSEVKDVGGFVGGTLKSGRRKAQNVAWRQVLTLDADYAGQAFIETVKSNCSFAYCIYSTHSHTKKSPRLRLLIALNRPVSPEEYAAVGRRVAADLGIDRFDDTTYEPHRLMYWPSCPRNSEFVFEYQDGPWLNPDAILSRYHDWTDPHQWPESSRVQQRRKKLADRQGDPHDKPGVLGAFCRTYSVEDVIQKFLDEVYAPCGEGRYTYIPGSTSGGLVVYDEGKFVYSHHGTDPIGGLLVNAFDLVRIHKFGDLDEEAKSGTPVTRLPSYLAMQELCLADERVRVTLGEERLATAKEDFDQDDNWLKKLEYKKSGKLETSLANLVLILKNDPNLQGIYFNAFKNCIEADSTIPWERTNVAWDDGDSAHLEVYFDEVYEVYAPTKIQTALLSTAKTKNRHPVIEYLNSLPAWDGVERIDTLLIDTLGAKDTPYTRAVTRKTLVAAVARVRKPGVKFDHMLVLVGPQGIGKSTFFHKLGGDWFSDSLSITDMRDKTAAEKLQGCWILEISELAGMRKTDVEIIKSFLTRQDDKFRPSYGRFTKDHPRQNIIVGTTNQETGFLRDVTGNRRFWPVQVFGGPPGEDPFSLEKETVHQIWAEAAHLHEQGEKLFLEGELEKAAREEQTAALEEDDRMGMVEEFLNLPLPTNWDERGLADRRHYIHGTDLGKEPEGGVPRTQVSRIEIWCELFQGSEKDYTQKTAAEITNIIEKIGGWRQSGRVQLPIYGRQRVFVRSGQGRF